MNGRPIDRGEFIERLLEARGLGLLQQLVFREAVRQEAARRGVAVTPADVENEYDLTARASHFDGKDVENLTPARRQQLIDEWMRTRGISRVELRLAMERQAALRKLVQNQVQITEEMLRKEFDRVHGERVEVRHIQLAAPRYYEQVRARLDKGEDFERLVREFSQNALSREKGGLLPAFNRSDDTVPRVFVEAALAMQPGEVSNPIEAMGSYHVLKLERRIPADNVDFEKVRDVLAENLHARLTVLRMEELGRQLLLRSELRITDRVMREQYRQGVASGLIEGPSVPPE